MRKSHVEYSYRYAVSAAACSTLVVTTPYGKLAEKVIVFARYSYRSEGRILGQGSNFYASNVRNL